MSTKQDHPDDDEKTLFRDAMLDADKHRNDKIAPFKPRLPPIPRPPNPEVTGNRPDDQFADLNIETPVELSFIRPGIQNRLFQDLRRGHLPPQECLDLHGLRVAEARTQLAKFLVHCRYHRLRVVHIIHGKGYGSEEKQPVLKQKINQWLRQREEVLAFCSAPRFDGGVGAVYVLLSRKV
ncbi:MAG: DNA mismatch repair protein MutS [Gammaproteobacteria bacterium]|nr:DNA mismatch repair protein MutS [Gammaproteobacteria bacterium]